MSSVSTIVELVTDASSLKTTNKLHILKGTLTINMFCKAGTKIDLSRKLFKDQVPESVSCSACPLKK